MKLKIMLVYFWTLYAFATGAPVFDIANWVQNGQMIMNQASEYKTQIDQYKNQINQYQNMLDNTKSLSSFEWDNANSVINNLLESTNTIDYYKQEAGSLQSYLDRFQSQEYYQKTSCFNDSGQCSAEDLRKIKQARCAASVAEKRANDAMLKGIDKLIAKATEIPVRVADDPLTCVVRGTGIIFEDEDLLREIVLPSPSASVMR